MYIYICIRNIQETFVSTQAKSALDGRDDDFDGVANIQRREGDRTTMRGRREDDGGAARRRDGPKFW